MTKTHEHWCDLQRAIRAPSTSHWEVINKLLLVVVNNISAKNCFHSQSAPKKDVFRTLNVCILTHFWYLCWLFFISRMNTVWQHGEVISCDVAINLTTSTSRALTLWHISHMQPCTLSLSAPSGGLRVPPCLKGSFCGLGGCSCLQKWGRVVAQCFTLHSVLTVLSNSELIIPHQRISQAAVQLSSAFRLGWVGVWFLPSELALGRSCSRLWENAVFMRQVSLSFFSLILLILSRW